ncbi:MAG: hypothetical protein B1H13_10605 [Desulfobacteraceae bacterium 4484_190.3]|nr:MAG: hypothetical protein B1H13_10605 [Desulfobacteraceae bacterium 4484_190.3]
MGKTWRISVAFVVFVALGGSSCGYHFQQTGRPHGLKIRSIAIPMVKSPASTLGFEGAFTRVIREEFIDHSGLAVVSKEEADAVLEMRIDRITSDPLAYDVTQSNVQGGTVNYETDRASGKVLWEERGEKEKASYAVTSDPLETRYNRRMALRKIARTFAKKAYAQTMERF